MNHSSTRPSASARPPSRRASRPAAALALALALVALAGCSSKLEGEVSVSGGEAGEMTLRPDACLSAERKGLFGVQLHTEANEAERMTALYQPDDSWEVRVNVPSRDYTLVLARERCERFDVVVQKQSSSINGITNVEGHIALDCDLGTTGRVQGRVSFENCH